MKKPQPNPPTMRLCRKPGPRPRPADEVASVPVASHLTPKETLAAKAQAKAADLSLSRWIRRCITNSTL